MSDNKLKFSSPINNLRYSSSAFLGFSIGAFILVEMGWSPPFGNTPTHLTAISCAIISIALRVTSIDLILTMRKDE